MNWHRSWLDYLYEPSQSVEALSFVKEPIKDFLGIRAGKISRLRQVRDRVLPGESEGHPSPIDILRKAQRGFPRVPAVSPKIVSAARP